MKRTNLSALLFVAAMVGALAFTALGQTSVADNYLISAKAGGVNYLEGTVTSIRADGTSGLLLRRDRIEIGDRVSTGPDGRAEILLNPGSYIRLGRNSSFEFGSTDLEDLQIKLDSGSAVFEVFAADEFRVSVSTPKGKVALIETGIYRVDVSSSGTALLSVSRGKAEVGDGSVQLVKEGRTGTIGTGTVAIAKFDKDKRDDLAEWSRNRSKELAKVASALRDKQVGTSLLRTYNSGLWSIFNSFGLWIYDPFYNGYCFLPFGHGWRSPYGWPYRSGINWYNFPIRNPPIINPNPSRKVSTRVPVPTGKASETPAAVRTGVRSVFSPPPFTKVRRDHESSGGGFGGGFNTKGSGDYNDRSTPSYSSPSYSPPASSMPAERPAASGSKKDN